MSKKHPTYDEEYLPSSLVKKFHGIPRATLLDLHYGDKTGRYVKSKKGKKK